MKVCLIDLGQVGLGWDGLGCNIALRWGTDNSSTIVNTRKYHANYTCVDQKHH